MNVRPILDMIAKHESRGDYDIVWGRISRRDHPPKKLTQMTIGEVLDWQDSIDPHYLSEAAGRYQILEDTLRGLYREAGLTRADLFNEANQDRLAVQLLERRGLNDWLAMRISTAKFANNLAKEWASLPVVSGPKAGRSYYSGDGLNKALVSAGEVLSVLQAVRGIPATKSPVWGLVAALWAWLRKVWRMVIEK